MAEDTDSARTPTSTRWDSHPRLAPRSRRQRSRRHISLNVITPDAGHLYFNTAERLTGSDLNDAQDIYERTGGTTTLVSIEAGPPTGIPPATTITSGPSGTIIDPTPTFTFTTDEPGSSFQCKVDAGAFAACTAPSTTAALGAGSHTFQVRAVDIVGNADASPASRSFTVLAKCGGKTPTIIGTAGADVLTGTGGADVVVALGGKDRVRGLGAGDLLCGGAGNDTLIGGGEATSSSARAAGTSSRAARVATSWSGVPAGTSSASSGALTRLTHRVGGRGYSRPRNA